MNKSPLDGMLPDAAVGCRRSLRGWSGDSFKEVSCQASILLQVDIYLDNNATTPVDPTVAETVMRHLADRFGNAASSHVRGRAAASAVDVAREQVADLLSVAPPRVVWTSGATEAINTALKGLAEVRGRRSRLVVSAVEHKAVLDVAEYLAGSRGVELCVAPVNAAGAVDVDVLRTMVNDETFAVAVMAANNETGVLNPVEDIVELARTVGASYVCDATQQAGKLPLNLSEVDFAAVSAHKLYGPQGVGALITPRRMPDGFPALLHGGSHERGFRAGTLNLPGVAGFGTAASLATVSLEAEPARLADLRDELERGLAKLGDMSVNGADAARLPNTTSVRLGGVDADALIVAIPQIAFSSGSACTSAVPSPSHVLLAMGLSSDAAEQSIRLSVGRFTTAEDVARAIQLIAASAEHLRLLGAAR